MCNDVVAENAQVWEFMTNANFAVDKIMLTLPEKSKYGKIINKSKSIILKNLTYHTQKVPNN